MAGARVTNNEYVRKKSGELEVRRIRLSTICSVAIYIMVIIMLRGDLFFVSNENSHENFLRLIVLLIAICICFLIRNANFKALNESEYNFAKHYIFIVMIIGLLFLLYTSSLYGYTLYQSFSLSLRFIYIVVAIPIIYVMQHEKGKKSFWDILLAIFLIFLVVRFIAWLSYNYLPVHLFENFAEEYSEWTRNGRKRLVGGQLFGVAFIITIAKTMSRKNLDFLKAWKSRLGIILVFFMIIYCAIVMQSRYSTMTMVVTVFVTFYFMQKKTVSKLSLFILVAVCFGFLTVGGIIPEFISSFSVNSQYGEGTLSRLMGIDHFWSLFRTLGKNIGLGYIVNGYGTENLFVWSSRPWLDFYISDLGILGSFFRYGVFIIPIYGWLFFKMTKLSYGAIKRNSEYSSFLVPMTTYYILSSILVDQYEPSTMFSLPFYIAIVSYLEPKLYSKCKKKVLQIKK